MTSTVFAWDTDAMPRRPPQSAKPDDWAAWRIGYERERRGWSQGELARQVTAAGAPMQQQAIWKIENGDPPRRISLGEAIAFSQVFDIDVAELGDPPEEIAQTVLWGIKESARNWQSQTEELKVNLQDIRGLPDVDPAVRRDVLDILRGWLEVIEAEVAEVRSWLASESEET